MDWRKLIFPPNEIEFCAKQWMPAVLFLTTSTLVIFVWALYIVGVSTDEFDLEEYSISTLPGSVHQSLATNQLQNGFPALQPVAQTGLDLAAIKKHISPAIVHIHGRRLPAKGILPEVLSSGVLVHPAGYVITTYHDLIGRKAVYVDVKTLNGLQRYKASIVHASTRRDLVLLKLKTNDRFLFFKLASEPAVVGASLYSFGLDKLSRVVGMQGTLQKRGVATTVAQKNLSLLYSTNAISSWAQSGGPVLNANMELEGVGLATTDGHGGINGYTIPAHILLKEFSGMVKLTIAQNNLNQINPGQSNGQAVAFAQPPMNMNIAATQTGQAMLAPVVDAEHNAGFRLGGYSLESLFGLALLGLGAGIVGGMMTMGGGIILVTGMFTFFGYGMSLIRPVAFVTNLFTYGAASLRNRETGLVMWDTVKALIPWTIGGVLLGYMLGTALDDQVVGYLLGVFALLMAAKVLHEIYYEEEDVAAVYQEGFSAAHGSEQSKQAGAESLDDLIDTLDTKESKEKTSSDLMHNGLLGLPMGLVSGLLGISGGVIEVPLQRYFAGISLRNAIANSSVMVFWASLSASIVSLFHGTAIGIFEWKTPLGLALIMIPSSYLGGMLGARLFKHVSVTILNWVYVGLMLIVGIKMLFGQ